MTDQATETDLTSMIGAELPFLRRYARALTGSQGTGDNYAIATLEAILEDSSVFEEGLAPKAALFRTFHKIWSSSGAPVAEEESGLRARAQTHMSKLTANSREALLLHTVEDFSYTDLAAIMEVEPSEAEGLVSIARKEMQESVAGRILIIEDEAIIAMDLESIVSEMGHTVTGIARTHSGAVQLGKSEVPDLILADIQLADNSSGIDAVNELLTMLGDTPVIFITAFPERLLTGDKPEPAFLISKPYSEEQVRSAVSQAMFFSSTETLRA
ncbi:response regulator [Pacificitalea manganoxidans]|uniref:Response regulator n=1 Tax=Pacificitalea manganoxidans TaxID=1411902 RepID=A0A291LXY0_9RHOB|nr:response regulator [Pacificitalea manganoxidans]MAQ47036.1 response regulator [Actibacterium sp.]OWU69186.1 two-component response regulator [Roseovarius sp. 22II1-1F6A]ATI41305.1 response regulator [Pacificitalea manganoxidans]MBF52367.1 response regulator [Actibacterium sp.]MDR6308702.1 DNA-directed RNA polymerase specialized sigma24 family protein/CheY-like chemotaxis protein [Pacificitalea manganoxidans]